jgi:uncharacterized protein (TIGR03437 family)
MLFDYTVDDGIGDALNSGVYVNGKAVCATNSTSFSIVASQEHSVNCGDVSSALIFGTNWLYVEGDHGSSPAGLIFSATFTTINATVPSINPNGIVNNAAGAAPVAPGSLASAYGSYPVVPPAQASSVPLPVNMSGLTVQFGGISAPLLYASGVLVNLQVPWEMQGQSQATVVPSTSNQAGPPQAVNIATFAPGIFSVNGQGTGQGAILDGTYRLVDASNPATAGTTTIQIFCTGLGPVTNQPASGSPALGDPLSPTTTTPVATIGGVPASVAFSGLTPGAVGLYQVNALVPSGTSEGSAVPVTINVGGVSSNTVTIGVYDPPSPNLNLTGSWTGTWSASHGDNGNVTASLSQSGTTVSGTISFANSCLGLVTPSSVSALSVSGSINGRQLTLVLAFGSTK